MKVTVETIDEFEAALKSMKPEQVAHMHYDVFKILFPPGEPNEDARARAAALAKATGCTIDAHAAPVRSSNTAMGRPARCTELWHPTDIRRGPVQCRERLGELLRLPIKRPRERARHLE